MTSMYLTPVGGLGETGALNSFLYHTDKTAILVDAGVRFVDERSPGASLIVPNFEALESFRSILKAVVLTHGHEDHIGSLPFFLKIFKVPVYATEFTKHLIQNKLAEHGLRDQITVHLIKPGKSFKIGEFEIEPVHVNHSIPDTVALYIRADGRSLMHLTDFKIDKTPTDRVPVADLKRFAQIGDSGLDVLLLDSTNSFGVGWTVSESEARKNLIETIKQASGRCMVCLFSSNAYRLQAILNAAKETGRAVAFTGRSTREYSRIAFELAKLDATGVELFDIDSNHHLSDERILLVATGSQAEPRSVLSRLSKDMFVPFKAKLGDTLIMSSKMIPGNEGKILDMLNRLALLGVKIITDDTRSAPIHASGHARQDELIEVTKLLRPKHFIPIHGEYRLLCQNIEVVSQAFVAAKQEAPESRLLLNGTTLKLTEHALVTEDMISIGVKFVSEDLKYFIEPEAMRKRKKLMWNGEIAVSLTRDMQTSELMAPLQVFSQGMFGGSYEVKLATELAQLLEDLAPWRNIDADEKLIKKIKSEVKNFYRNKHGLAPEVLVLVHSI